MQQQTESKKQSKRDVHQEVTDKIINLLETGTVPWHQLFHNPQLGFAQNFCTGHQYQGINWLLLNFMVDYEAPYYLTWKQIQKLGGRVQKGSKAIRIYYADFFYKNAQGKRISVKAAKQAETNGQEVQKHAFLKGYSVFNITCVDNINWEMPVLEPLEMSPIERCEALLEKLAPSPSIRFVDQTSAFYDAVRDWINMPRLKQFSEHGPKAYYRVLFHELVHWTGHETRLNRFTPLEDQSEASRRYAVEELIAELGACILSAHLEINTDALYDNSAAYIQFWLEQLKADKHFIFRAASQAQKAVDYLLGGKTL